MCSLILNKPKISAAFGSEYADSVYINEKPSIVTLGFAGVL